MADGCPPSTGAGVRVEESDNGFLIQLCGLAAALTKGLRLLFGPRLQRRINHLLTPVTYNRERHAVAGRVPRQLLGQLADGCYRAAIYGSNHIPTARNVLIAALPAA